ncbi:MAG: hypothetical protein COB66_08180 [Coxiella sp. (in: Bacteria)]|nr:MAG: hypothetical protein COB66_08180 [Coxiella sp. (in: g-proteobacteria)]
MQHLEEIRRFAHSTDPLMLVLGNTGTGKTDLLDHVVSQVTMSHPIIRLKGRDHIKPRPMIKQLSEQWEVAVVDQTTSLSEQLQELVDGLIRQDNYCLLLVDDAHLLPFSVLAALVHIAIQQDTQCHMHLVLSGRISLFEKVHTLHDQTMPVIRLGIMRHQEARQRIQSFLDDTHIKANETVVDGMVTRIYKESHGVPELIDKSLRALTVQDFIKSKHIIPEEGKMATASTAKQSRAAKELLVGKQGARAVAFVGLVATLFGLYWYEHHSHALSPPLPGKPYSYALAKTFKLPVAKPAAIQPAPNAIVTPMPQPKQNFYTLQLMGSFNKSDITNYIAAHHLQAQAQAITEQYQQKPWYILGIGQYKTAQAANVALHQLPTSVRHKGAWVRHI